MPTYDYRCEKCGDFELSQKMSEAALTVCPTCGSSVQRLISAPAFHLKGTGWYKTDYASGSSNSSSTPNGTAKPKAADAPAAADSTATTTSPSSASTSPKPTTSSE